jgi:hypothetical protein
VNCNIVLGRIWPYKNSKRIAITLHIYKNIENKHYKEEVGMENKRKMQE